MPKATAPPSKKVASNQNIHRRVHAWDIHVKFKPREQNRPLILYQCNFVLYALGAHIDTYIPLEHAPQNCLQNDWAIMEVSELVFSCFLPYAHQLLSHLIWSLLHDLGLYQIPSHSMKMLHKTIYEVAEPL